MILPVAVQPVPEIHHLWLVVAILGLRFSKNEVHRGPTMSHHVPPCPTKTTDRQNWNPGCRGAKSRFCNRSRETVVRHDMDDMGVDMSIHVKPSPQTIPQTTALEWRAGISRECWQVSKVCSINSSPERPLKVQRINAKMAPSEALPDRRHFSLILAVQGGVA